MATLEDDIKTPYQYFERRYGNRKYVRTITATFGIFFYFSFLSLFLWCCANLLTTLIPQCPLWVSCICIGLYSIIGSTIGGFTQSTKINVFQFIILITGLVISISFTFKKFSTSMTILELFEFDKINNRTEFFNLNVDLTTRYTILNQLLSLSLPWSVFHAFLQPNFNRYRFINKSNIIKGVTVIFNFPFMLLLNLIVFITGGSVMFLYFYGCDPFKNETLFNRNQLGAFWLLSVLSQNVPSYSGILFASIMYYSIVQHSMGMALSVNLINSEILQPMLIYFRISIIEYKVKIMKIFLTIFLGLISILYATSFQYVKNTALSLFFLFNNSTNSPILGLYLLSAFNPYANHVGAMTAFVINMSINYWLGLGNLNIFSKTKSQEFTLSTSLCNHTSITNLTSAAIELNYIQSLTNVSLKNENYYPENQVILYLYSIATIWYCLFSVLFTFIFGSIFSLLYSLIIHRSYDSDSEFSHLRKNYLFYKLKNNYYR